MLTNYDESISILLKKCYKNKYVYRDIIIKLGNPNATRNFWYNIKTSDKLIFIIKRLFINQIINESTHVGFTFV